MKRKQIRYGDTVTLLDYPEGDINRYATFEKVGPKPGSILVSNMNMPWQGTLGWEMIPKGRWKRK